MENGQKKGGSERSYGSHAGFFSAIMNAADPELPIQWHDPHGVLVLSAGGVHVWRISLAGIDSDVQLNPLQEVLQPDERRKAGKYYFQNDRTSFIVTRSLLRIILGLYLAVPPEDICFSYNRNGKPFINSVLGNRENLQFNATHSQEVSLIVLTINRRIGIDVEQISGTGDFSAVMKRCFSAEEIEKVISRDKDDRKDAFCRSWTRKEAYAKAIGAGLAHSLFNPLSTPASLPESGRYSILTFQPYCDYMASLAVEGAVSGISGWNAEALLRQQTQAVGL